MFKTIVEVRCMSTKFQLEKPAIVHQNQNHAIENRKPVLPRNYRFIYPEFLPDPKIEWRNITKEKLERIDMLNRR